MRLAFWESTVAMIQDHPFLGIGWGAYWMVYPEYDFYLQGANVLIVHAHNIYLNYMAEIGIPGAVAFFWFFFGTMVMALRTHFPEMPVRKLRGAFRWERLWTDWEESDILAGLSQGIGLAVLSVALNGLTDDLLFNIPSSMLLWMIAALAGVLSCMSPQKAAAEKKAGGNEFLARFRATAVQNAKEAKDKVQGKVEEKVHGMLYRETPVEPEGADRKASDAKPTAPAADAAPEPVKAADAPEASEAPQKPLDPMDELAEEVRKALEQRKQEEEAAEAEAAAKETAAAPKGEVEAETSASEPEQEGADTAGSAEDAASPEPDRPEQTELTEEKAETAGKPENGEKAEKKAEEKKEAKEADSHEENERDIKGDH